MGSTRTYIVDLERLQRSGEDGILVIRLMMAINDISLAVKCAREFKKEQPGISKHAQQANRRYFIQLQCGHLHEALNLVKEVTQSSVMTSMISKCPKVTREAYQALLDYVTGGPKRAKFGKYIASIRHNVAFHYQEKPVRQALASCLGRQGSRRSTITLGSDPTLVLQRGFTPVG